MSENHRAKKPTKYSLLAWPSIHIGSQMARRGDLACILVRQAEHRREVPLCRLGDEELDAFPFWTIFSSPHLSHFHASACFLLRQSTDWALWHLTKYPVCGLKGQFLSAWQSTQPFLLPGSLNLNLQRTQSWLRDTYIWGENLRRRLHGRQGYDGRMPLPPLRLVILKTNFLNEMSQAFHFLSPSFVFSFSFLLSFCVRIYSYKGLALGITKVTS